MTGGPDVSVVIPALDCERFIGAAIDSALGQEGVRTEVLVIDDGSTDGTAEIVRGYGEPVRLLRTAAPRSGPGAARNVGLRHAAAPLIAFLDGDDIWLPGKLARQKRLLDGHPEVALVCAQSISWYPEGTEAPLPEARGGPDNDTPLDVAGWSYALLLMQPDAVWTTTVVVRRSLVERIGGFDETLRLGQDYEYWLRASRETPVLRVARPLALYRQHENNSTHTAPRMRNYELEIVERALARWGRRGPDGTEVSKADLRRRIARLHFRMGYIHCWRGSPSVAVRAFCRSALHNPWRWKAWAYIAVASGRSLWRAAGGTGFTSRSEPRNEPGPHHGRS